MRRDLLELSAMIVTASLAACQPGEKTSGGAEKRRPAPAVTATGDKALASSEVAASASAPVLAASASAPPAEGSAVASAAPPGSAAVPVASGAPAVAAAAGEACRLTRGPIQLAFTGAATVWLEGAADEPKLAFNRDGVARVVSLPPVTPRAKDPKKSGKAERAIDFEKPERLALAEPAERATAPGCVEAGGSFFCVDREGGVHRAPKAGAEGPVVARARPGGPFAAVTLGGGHVAYAFLGDRKTSEGVMSLAFAGYDDETPMLLSEDGAGATFVTLAARGADAVALYVDARRAMTPVHARVVSIGASQKLSFGPDAVLFVGEGAEGRTPAALAQGGPGPGFALLPASKDVKAFGMAAVRIDEQPKDDAPVTWSLYPSALERAPLAVSKGPGPTRVLRVRPVSDDPKSKRALELGALDGEGRFTASCVVAEGSSFVDLTVTPDRAGGAWLTYTDADGTWVERRGP